MDKAGQPTILHPLRLMMRVGTETEKIVAGLHDVVEDSQPPQRWGLDELRREGFSEPVLPPRSQSGALGTQAPRGSCASR